MQTLIKKRMPILLVMALAITLSYASCSSKHDRSYFLKDSKTREKIDLEKESSVEGLADVDDGQGQVSPNGEELEISEEMIKFEESFIQVLEAAQIFRESEQRIDTYSFFKEFGLDPQAQVNEMGVMAMAGTRPSNGMGYFIARFDTEKRPEYFTFEVESFEGAYEKVIEMIEATYSDLGEPCFKSIDNMVAYQDGDFLIEVSEVTQENIDMGHPNKPRLKKHIGNIEVVIEADIHPGTCGGLDDHHGE